jgi:capsule polysaccharide export protein KpsE/RkpR
VEDKDAGNQLPLSSLAGSGLAASAMGGLLSGAQSSVLPMDLYTELMNGREVLLAAVDSFHLDTLYKSKRASKDLLVEKLYSELMGTIDATSGMLTVSYEAKNKQLAFDLVNFVVERANQKYMQLRKKQSMQNLEHLRMVRASLGDSVRIAGQKLVDFYRENKLLDLETQLKLTLKALSAYEEQIQNYQLSEARLEGNYATLQDLRKKRSVLERQFRELRGEYAPDYKPSTNSIYVNSDWAVEKLLEQKEIEVELARLVRMHETMCSQEMLAEANQLKQAPVIQIVQPPFMPDWKSGPKRVKWAIVAFALGFVIANCVLVLRALASGELPTEENTRNILLRLLEAARP